MTPKNYLDFVSNFRRQLASSRRQVDETSARLGGGLEKLVQAAAEVEAMQAELAIAQRVVEQATVECTNLLQVRH